MLTYGDAYKTPAM